MLVCLLFVYYFAATMVNKRLSHRSRLQSAASGSAMREKLAASSRRRHLRRRHLDYPLRAVSGHFDVRQSVRPPARPPVVRLVEPAARQINGFVGHHAEPQKIP